MLCVKWLWWPLPKEPCKLDEDYTEYDDPDDFFPDIPTLVPWYSINCTNPSDAWTSIKIEMKHLDDNDQEGSDKSDEVLGKGDSNA